MLNMVSRHLGQINKPFISGLKQLWRCKCARKIIVEPQTSLVTDRVSIYGEGFEANEAITIQGSISCEPENLSFKSFGHFMTSQASCYDLSQKESVGGTYTGIDEMGLFWSAKEIGDSKECIQMSNASETLNYTFSVFTGHLDQDDLDSMSPISFCQYTKEVSRRKR